MIQNDPNKARALAVLLTAVVVLATASAMMSSQSETDAAPEGAVPTDGINYYDNPDGSGGTLIYTDGPYNGGTYVDVKFINVPVNDGKVFLGWATDAAAAVPDYSTYGERKINNIGGVNLYAVWGIPFTTSMSGDAVITYNGTGYGLTHGGGSETFAGNSISVSGVTSITVASTDPDNPLNILLKSDITNPDGHAIDIYQNARAILQTQDTAISIDSSSTEVSTTSDSYLNAIVHVPAGAEITFLTQGKVEAGDVYTYESTLNIVRSTAASPGTSYTSIRGAAVGGDGTRSGAAENAGTITIEWGLLQLNQSSLSAYNSGALIGGGGSVSNNLDGSGSGDGGSGGNFTLNGGTLSLGQSVFDNGQLNGSTYGGLQGALIGGGGAGSSGTPGAGAADGCKIEINGGVIITSINYMSYTSSYIIGSGGNGSEDPTDPSANLFNQAHSGDIEINGGLIYYYELVGDIAFSFGALMGGRTCSITINGGTIEAAAIPIGTNPHYLGDMIGIGGRTNDASGRDVQINGGNMGYNWRIALQYDINGNENVGAAYTIINGEKVNLARVGADLTSLGVTDIKSVFVKLGGSSDGYRDMSITRSLLGPIAAGSTPYPIPEYEPGIVYLLLPLTTPDSPHEISVETESDGITYVLTAAPTRSSEAVIATSAFIDNGTAQVYYRVVAVTGYRGSRIDGTAPTDGGTFAMPEYPPAVSSQVHVRSGTNLTTALSVLPSAYDYYVPYDFDDGIKVDGVHTSASSYVKDGMHQAEVSVSNVNGKVYLSLGLVYKSSFWILTVNSYDNKILDNSSISTITVDVDAPSTVYDGSFVYVSPTHIPIGYDITVSAQPKSGYTFMYWKENYYTLNPNMLIASSSGSSDRSLSAFFGTAGEISRLIMTSADPEWNGMYYRIAPAGNYVQYDPAYPAYVYTGENFSLSATSNFTYTFVGWTSTNGSAVDHSLLADWTFVSKPGTTNVVADFSGNVYSVTIEKNGDGVVAMTINGGHYAFTYGTAFNVSEDSTLVLTATKGTQGTDPVIVVWQFSYKTAVSVANPLTPDRTAGTITANFEQYQDTYGVTISGNADGTIQVNNGDLLYTPGTQFRVMKNTELEFSVVPASGKRLYNWVVTSAGTTTYPVDLVYDYVVSADVAISAVMGAAVANDRTVTIDPGSQGEIRWSYTTGGRTISGTGTVVVANGTVMTFSLINSGAEVPGSWTFAPSGGQTVTVNDVSPRYTVEADTTVSVITLSHMVLVTLAPPAGSTITATWAGGTAHSSFYINAGTAVVFDAGSAAGRKVSAWTLTPGGTFGGETLNYTVSGTMTVTVSYTARGASDVLITIIQPSADGSISWKYNGMTGNGNFYAAIGVRTEFNANSGSGYKVGSWTLTPGGTFGGETINRVISSAMTVTVSYTAKAAGDILVTVTQPAAYGLISWEHDGITGSGNFYVAAGTSAEFYANSNSGRKVNAWTLTPGGTFGGETLNYTVTQTMTVTVSFAALGSNYVLVTVIQPDADGSISWEYGSSKGNGNVYVAKGAALTVIATPDTSCAFGGWTYDASEYGTQTPVNLPIDSEKTVSGTFTDNSSGGKALLTLTVGSNGEVTVGSLPNAVTVGTYSFTYDVGSEVTLTAAGLTGYTFLSWTGVDGDLNMNPGAVTIASAGNTVTAGFRSMSQDLTEHRLNISVGTGGTVAVGGMAGTLGEGDHLLVFPFGTIVTLTAAASSGYVFDAWSGTSGTYNPASVTMDSDKTVSVSFRNSWDNTRFNMNLTVGARGSVTDGEDTFSWSSSANVFEKSYDAYENVLLTASPASEYTFARWTGDLGGTEPSVNLAMDGSKEVQAVFASTSVSVSCRITATSDSGTSISPSGSVSVERGSSITFRFSALPGNAISYVYVDGDPLAPEQTASGTYTFTGVAMDHRIDVRSISSRTEILLEIDIASGVGHAQYSINGGGLTLYDSPTVLPYGSSVTLKAVIVDGYSFASWWVNDESFTSQEVTFDDVTSTLHVVMYFNDIPRGTSEGGGILWLFLILLPIIITVCLMVWYYERKKEQQ